MGDKTNALPSIDWELLEKNLVDGNFRHPHPRLQVHLDSYSIAASLLNIHKRVKALEEQKKKED